MLQYIGFASAANWDNVYDYDEETKTATIENWFGIGEDLAYITLTSPQNKMVARGNDKLVGEFNFTTTGNFTEIFNDIYLTDMKNGNAISRGKQFKYKKYTNISVDDYENVCENITTGNGTVIQNCTQIEIGNHWEIKMDWIPIVNPTNIFYDGVTYEIGVFVDVEVGDYGDWIPSIMGVEIEEWATWTESLNVNISHYYKMDDNLSTTNVIDSIGITNGTLAGGDNTQDLSEPGIINLSLKFNGIDDNVDLNFIPTTAIDFTWVVWAKTSTVGTQWLIASGGEGADTTVGVDMIIQADGTVRVFSGTAGGERLLGDSTTTVDNGAWHFIALTFDGVNGKIYVDGGGAEVNTSWTPYISDNNLFMAKRGERASGYLNGNLDEIGIWNRSLSDGEILQLYNNGTAITFKDVFVPTLTILFPENITYNESITELNYTNSSDATDCWFSKDGGVTNSSAVTCGTNFTTTSVAGINTWTVYGNDSVGGVGSDTVTFFVNKTVQTELISPANLSNFTSTFVNFTTNSTPINTNLTNVTLFVWFDNSTLFFTNTTILSGENEIQTEFFTNLTEGLFLWNVETCGEDVACSFATNNRTVEVHITPSTVIIHFPNGTIDFFKLGENSTLNWTISEPGQNLSEHITNCSYTYNEVELFLNQSQCIEINETSFLYVNGVNNLTFEAVDEFNLTTVEITFWNYTILEINQTFDNITIEGNLQNISSVIKLGDGLTISAAILNYNGTLFAGTSTVLGENMEILKSNLVTPSVSADENITFHWSIVLSGGEIINLSDQNQTILNLGIDNCSSFTTKIFNISIVDEEEQTIIVNDTVFEIALNILSSDRSVTVINFSQQFDDINPISICIDQVISPGIQYSMDSIMRYTAEGYANEYFNIVDAELTNDTGTTNITLFDLNITDSTEFQLTFKGTDFLPVENALIFVERQYISEDTFKTVELPKTDSNGQTVLHMVRNSVIYNIRVVKDNEVLKIFNNVIAFCQDFTIGNCVINLNAISNESGVFNYDDGVGITYSATPNYNQTSQVISFSFASTDGTTKNIFMNVERRDIFGNISVCNNTVVSSSGTLSCVAGASVDNATLITTITVDGEEWLTFSTIVDDVGYGSIGYVFWFFFTLALILMFGESKNGVMIGILISYIGAVGLGIAIGGVVGIGSAGIWIMVISSVGIYKINKNRKR